MDKIKFGILGCGTIAKRFAKALYKSGWAVPYACAARDLSRAENFASENAEEGHRILAYGSYQALLDNPEIRAVYIATVNSTHADIAKMAILSGKAVICEKPFFIHAKDAEETIALAREKQILMMEGFWTRTLPAYLKAKEWIKAGKIGDVTLIRAAFCFNIPYNDYTKDNRLFDPKTGGGAFFDVGVYNYEYVTGIMEAEPVEVQYLKQNTVTGVDGATALIMKFESGAVADTLSGINGYMEDTGIISGTKGFIKQYCYWGCKKTELYTGRSPEPEEVFTDDESEGFVHEIRHFVNLLKEGKTESDLIPLQDTLNYVKRAEEILF